MTNILLTCILLVFISTSIGLLLTLRRIYAVFVDFISPEADNKPSPLAMVGEAFSLMLARAIMAQIKTTLMGMQSGQARGEKAISEAYAQDQIDSNPALSAVTQLLPNVRRTLRKNTGLLDIATAFLSQKLGGLNTSGNGNSPVSVGNRPKFQL